MKFLPFCLLLLFCQLPAAAYHTDDYTVYHKQITLAEEFIAEKEYAKALQLYEHTFNQYEFVFLRDYQIATQLALYTGNTQKAWQYLRLGIASGWTKKSIRKNSYLNNHLAPAQWKAVKKEYDSLHTVFEQRINQEVRAIVRKMIWKDQWKALGALFTFSSEKQDRYAERKFAPHSEKQLARFSKILAEHGYPGEKLIGNSSWMLTILSHHNSISRAYIEKDTLYPFFRPTLLQAIGEGELTPFEFAFIDSWYREVGSGHQASSYGILGDTLTMAQAAEANHLRRQVGVGSLELRNKLVDIEQETGMDLYLPGKPWVTGKTKIE